jgi:hypothetical protein
LLVGFVVGLSCGIPSTLGLPCTEDEHCNGEQVCHEGLCVNPDDVGTSTGTTGSGQTSDDGGTGTASSSDGTGTTTSDGGTGTGSTGTTGSSDTTGSGGSTGTTNTAGTSTTGTE